MSKELSIITHDHFAEVERFERGFKICLGIAETFQRYDQIPDSFYGKNDKEKKNKELAIGKFALALSHGIPMGLTPQQCAMWLYPVSGRVDTWGSGTIFLIRRCAGFVYLKDEPVMEDNKIVGHRVWAKRFDEEVSYTYTRKMAEIAGLWPMIVESGGMYKQAPSGYKFQDAWCKNPTDMLFYKALARVKNRLFPDIGSSIKEDMEGVFDETIPAEGVREILPDTDVEKNIAEILALSNPETQIATLKELAKSSTATAKTRILQVIQEIEDKLATVAEVAEVVEAAEVVEEKSEIPAIPVHSADAQAAHEKLLSYLKDEAVVKFFTAQEIDDFTICEVAAAPTLLVEMQTLAKQGSAFLKLLQKTKAGNARSIVAIKPENIRWVEFPWAKELLEEKVI
jgi:hypothetical protein